MRVLVDGLPPESRTKTAIRESMTSDELAALPEPDGCGAWSHEATLLAAACDRLDWVVHVLLAVNSEKGKSPKPPKPMRRPGVGETAADRSVRRRNDRLGEALRAYTLAHDGAYPPPEWFADRGVATPSDTGATHT